MRLLALDTSGRACSIALFVDGELSASRHELIGRGQAERIIPWIAEMIGDAKADQILVGCGPGSFTGVRIGIAAARALGLGWDVPVLGMDSLALIAIGIADQQRVTVAIEGGHGEIFVRAYENGTILSACSFLKSLTPQAAALQFDEDLVVGSGAEQLVEARGKGTAVGGEPDARRALALPEILRDFAPSPIYGRLPDAKVPA
jgi:tRNA threonylcarbamoyladenosine biosynthesis protein TsaB